MTGFAAQGQGPAPRHESLDRDAAARVLRRAVELAEQVDDPDPDRDISERALIEAAEEVGIDPDEVRRAIAEERLGLLDVRTHRGDSVVGPSRVSSARVVPGSSEEVLDRVDAWMRRGRSLRRVRRSTDRADYARRSDILAAAHRSIRVASGQEQLARVRRIRVVVRDAGGGRTLVGMVVDVSRSRTAATAGGVTVAATGVATAGIAAMTWAPWAWLGLPVAAAGGVGVMAARKGYVAEVDDELQSVLDSVASGTEPTSVLNDLTDRLLRSSRVRDR